MNPNSIVSKLANVRKAFVLKEEQNAVLSCLIEISEQLQDSNILAFLKSDVALRGLFFSVVGNSVDKWVISMFSTASCPLGQLFYKAGSQTTFLQQLKEIYLVLALMLSPRYVARPPSSSPQSGSAIVLDRSSWTISEIQDFLDKFLDQEEESMPELGDHSVDECLEQLDALILEEASSCQDDDLVVDHLDEDMETDVPDENGDSVLTRLQAGLVLPLSNLLEMAEEMGFVRRWCEFSDGRKRGYALVQSSFLLPPFQKGKSLVQNLHGKEKNLVWFTPGLGSLPFCFSHDFSFLEQLPEFEVKDGRVSWYHREMLFVPHVFSATALERLDISRVYSTIIVGDRKYSSCQTVRALEQYPEYVSLPMGQKQFIHNKICFLEKIKEDKLYNWKDYIQQDCPGYLNARLNAAISDLLSTPFLEVTFEDLPLVMDLEALPEFSLLSVDEQDQLKQQYFDVTRLIMEMTVTGLVRHGDDRFYPVSNFQEYRERQMEALEDYDQRIQSLQQRSWGDTDSDLEVNHDRWSDEEDDRDVSGVSEEDIVNVSGDREEDRVFEDRVTATSSLEQVDAFLLCGIPFGQIGSIEAMTEIASFYSSASDEQRVLLCRYRRLVFRKQEFMQFFQGSSSSSSYLSSLD